MSETTVDVRAGDVWEHEGVLLTIEKRLTGGWQFTDRTWGADGGFANGTYRLISRALETANEGPPQGYVECQYKCGRWTSQGSKGAGCNTCYPARLERIYGRDWTPTPAANPAAPDRSGCKPWCGIDISRELAAGEYGETAAIAFSGSAFNNGSNDPHFWCTHLCAAERRPPLRSDDTGGKEAAAKAQPVEAVSTVPKCLAMRGGRGLDECKTGLSPVARVDGGKDVVFICDAHWLAREEVITANMSSVRFATPAPTGTPLPADYQLPRFARYVPSVDETDLLPDADR